MRSFLATLTAALLLAAPAFAQSAAQKPPALTDKDRADLKRIETYLDSITTAKADFAQTSTTGKSGEGTFWLSRPGRLRFEFKAPSQDLIVADGTNITFWDAQLRSAQSAPIERTLANLFLRPKIQFGGELTVTSFEHFANVYRVEIAQANDVGAGRLTLVLLDQPLTLRQWRVTDAQNQVTDVTLSNTQFGGQLDPALFVFQEPKRTPKAR
ncbi:LolA family protein [Roseiterribacter gracilis]|uniref:Outer-membrane lipoprotein carrier protein n=1 Tax=Roseiterribacter gracilis TaxID=2812848 RepID=A0A8S8XEM9_9PROT|nr:outer-membrane lipoprotein carrier protein [Rhodospirillales bacterium TMPK1]